MWGIGDPDCPVDLGKLTASINGNESLQLFPYTDTTGNITIGYGTNLSAGISNDEAKYLRDNRISALIELLYNMGLPRLRTFAKALAALCNDDFEAAANEFLNSLWHRQVGHRAEVLAGMIATGQDGP
jgi:lysozyme